MALKDLIAHSPRRRRVLQALATGTAAVALSPLERLAADETSSSLEEATKQNSSRPIRAAQISERQSGAQQAPARLRKNGLVYRRLGRTGLYISEIVLGGSPFPDWSLFRELVDRGINYLDTSDSYENGNSDRLIGRLFREIGRDKVYVHARFHLSPRSTTASIVASAEASLKRLGTDYVDVFGIHGVERPEGLTDPRVNEAFTKLKAQGKFRFRGATCHANQHAVVPRAVESGLYDMIQFGYNIFDIQETEKDVRTYGDYLGESGARKLIDLAHARDVGVIAMKVLKVGGRRQDLARYKTAGVSVQQAMLKWALENEKIAAVVTEIMNRGEMEEDLGVIGEPLKRDERAALFALAAAKARVTCRFCGLCRSACPAGIPVPDIMRALLYAEGHGKGVRARTVYAEAMASAANPADAWRTREVAGTADPTLSTDENGNARTKAGAPRRLIGEACASCGPRPACELACPYGRPVRADVGRAARLLA